MVGFLIGGHIWMHMCQNCSTQHKWASKLWIEC